MGEPKSPFLRRVVLRNYKSIQECDVSLGPLTLLVGVNGSGKSNFLDALRFVAECLRTTMDQALRERGGIKEVRRRSRGHPTHFAIDLDLGLAERGDARYRFRVGAKQHGGFEVQEEDCRIRSRGTGEAFYQVRNGVVEEASFDPTPRVSTDRLYLTIASGLPQFRGLYDLLSGMGFYNISPEQLRDLQEPGAGNLLLRDGRNAASVVAWLERHNKQVKTRIEEYLGTIAPGVQQVGKKSLGHKETLEFKQRVAGDTNPWSFLAQNMSDGTLRALGVLVSLFQCFDRSPETGIPLVGIEEPEATLHPAAAGVLMDALREAAHFTQVVVTTHSPELLDTPDLDADSLLIVDVVEGETTIAPADDASKSSIRDRLSTAGELLKLDQLRPQPKPRDDLCVESDETRYPLFPTAE
jgi:predicted ATPase